MSGSPASSTPTVTREASKTESPTQLRDSSLLHSDENAIVEVTLQQHSVIETSIKGEMAKRKRNGSTGSEPRSEQEKEEEKRLLRSMRAEKVMNLEERMRGRPENIMNETPIGAKVEEVITPQSQKTKAKGEKKRGSGKRTPEVVRDTPRKDTLKTADKMREAEEEVESERESEERELDRYSEE